MSFRQWHDSPKRGGMRMIGGNQFPTLIEAKILIEQWWREYNKIRPHSAMHYCPPAPEAIQPIMISLTLGQVNLILLRITQFKGA
jgi:hypothetical protein